MNTTMAEGARARLVAQIAEGLFGQPGLTLMELENRVRLARCGGGPLLCGGCYGLGVIGYTSGQTPEQFEQGEYPCQDCAQPCPAGKGDVLVTDEMVDAACRAYFDTAEDSVAVDHTCMEAALKAALAPRQPVSATGKHSLTIGGEDAVAWMTRHDEPMLYPTFSEAAAYCDDDEPPIQLYAAHPAQAVDLGQFREAIQVWLQSAVWWGRHGREKCEEAKRLLALIDSQAVGNG